MIDFLGIAFICEVRCPCSIIQPSGVASRAVAKIVCKLPSPSDIHTIEKELRKND